MAGPKRDSEDQALLAQDSWNGGMNMINPGVDQFRDGKNMVCRYGKPRTRPGCRQYFGSAAGFIAGFWFNLDAEKFNDATHLGFWFPFNFVNTPWGSVIQGAEFIRLDAWTRNKVIFAVGGTVYVHEDGYLDIVVTTPAIDGSETVRFVQADNNIYMFRSGGNQPLFWDGSDTGFVVVPAAIVGDDIPTAPRAIYHGGRLWPYENDDLRASGVLDFKEYNNVTRYWTIERGAGEQGMFLYPFRDDIILAFKKDRVYALRAVNSIITSGTDLADYVYKEIVDEKTGSVAEYAITSVGEDVWYLGHGGIYSIFRNQQSKFQRDPVAVSAPIQPYINRINWAAASGACAITHNNYVLFAVPIDGSLTNNCILVFDRLMGAAGNGAWDMPWISSLLNPIRFFKDGEKCIFLTADYFIRELFTNDPWDSEDALSDTILYSATATYEIGALIKYDSNGEKIYKAIATTLGNLPTDTDFWTEQPDLQHVYDIESFIDTRPFELPPSNPPLRFGRGEVAFRVSNAKVSLRTMSRDQGTDLIHFTDREYDRREYDMPDGKADWVETNVDTDFTVKGRKDYSVLIGTSGLTVNKSGIPVGRKRTHNMRMLPLTANNKSLAMRITNKRGEIEIQNVAIAVAGYRHASMEAL